MFGGIECAQLRKHIIKPTLEVLDRMIPYSRAAENLLLGTAAQESHMGRYLKQIRGPALGIYQMEPETYSDIWVSFLSYRVELAHVIRRLTLSHMIGDRNQLSGNLYLATAMARIHYFRVKEALPKANDVAGLAAYWKSHFNTKLGRGTIQQFLDNYKRYIR